MSFKIKYLVIFIALIHVSLNAQTFTFSRISPKYVHDSAGAYAIISYGRVNNLTSQDITITFRRTTTNVPPQWQIAICTWIACYPPGVDSVTEICPPGQQSFSIYFYPYNTQGMGTTTIVAKNFSNPNENYSATFGASTSPISVKQISTLANEFNLSQNYPNPFNPATKISFSIPKNDYVDLRVYDILGREVKILLSQAMEAGEYEVEFEALNMSSGFYYYRLKSRDYVAVKKMVLVK